MNIRTKITAIVAILMALVLTGCGGGSGSDDDTPANVEDSPLDASTTERVLVETGDTATPYMLLDQSGLTVLFDTTAEGGLSRMTAIGPSGEVSSLSIDASTGHPTQLVTEYAVFLFGNVRQASGLVDVAMVSLDGEVQYFFDVDYQGGDSESEGEQLVITPLSATRASRDDNLFGDGNLEKMIDGGKIAAKIASCGITAAFVAGMVVDPALIPVFATVPGLAGLAGGGAIAGCTASLYSALKALTEKPDTAIKAALQAPLDASHVAARVYEAVGECSEGDYKKCAWKSGLVVYSALNSTNKRMYATLLQAKRYLSSREARAEFGVYCCNGPVKVAKGSSNRWRVLIDSSHVSGSYTYGFDFGDGKGKSLIVSSNSSYQMENTYYDLGNYEIQAEVTDAGKSKRLSRDSGDPFVVEVVEKEALLDVDCCDGMSKVHVNQLATWMPAITGGVKPYRYTIYWDQQDKTKHNKYVTGNDGEVKGGVYSYKTKPQSAPHIYYMQVSVSDDVGDTADSGYFSVEIVDPLRVSCCSGAVGAIVNEAGEWTFQVENAIKPYRYEIDWGDKGDKTIVDDKRVARVSEKHTYRQSGEYQITVNVTDASGATATSEPFAVTVPNASSPPPGNQTGASFHVSVYLNFDGTFKNAVQNPGFAASEADIWVTGTLDNLQINWRGGKVAAVGIVDVNQTSEPYAYAIVGDNKASLQNDIASPLAYGDYSLANAAAHEKASVPARALKSGGLYSVQLERFSASGSKETAFIQFTYE